MKRLIVLCASAALCLAVAVRADWKSVPLSGGARGCQESGTGVVVPMTDAKGKAYTSASSGTTACNGVRDLWAVLTGNSADAAPLRFTLAVNSDGTRDTTYPAGDKPPAAAALAWDTACVDAALAPIALQSTSSATSINVETCLSGTDAATSTIEFVQTDGVTSCAAQWSITGSTPNRTLSDASPSVGTGSCKLKATKTSSTLTGAYPWAYQAAPTDVTKPNYTTGLSCAPAGTGSLLCSFNASSDVAGDLATSGLAAYHFYRNGSDLSQNLTAAPGLTNTFTAAAIGTASGTVTQTGLSYDFSGDGGAGLEGTSDNVNQMSKTVSSTSVDIITRWSTIQTAATTNRIFQELRSSTSADAQAAGCTFLWDGTNLIAKSRVRTVIGGARANLGAATVLTSGVLGTPYLWLHYDSSGLDCSYSTDGNNWVAYISNATNVVLPATVTASIGTTATQAATSMHAVADFVSINNAGVLTKTLTGLAAGSATYSVAAADGAGNTQTALTGVTATPGAATSSGAIKWHPGYYVWCAGSYFMQYSSSRDQIKQCIDTYTVDPNVLGVLAVGEWAAFECQTAGTYDCADNGWGTPAGFRIWDDLISYAASKGKKLMIGFQPFHLGDYSGTWDFYFPKYLVQTSEGGSDASGTYSITPIPNSVLVPRVWKPAVTDRIIALTQAYCDHYDNNSTVELLDFNEQDTGLAGLPEGTDGFSYATYAAQFARIPVAARSHCQHTGMMLRANWWGAASQAASVMAAMGDPAGFVALGNSDFIPHEASYMDLTYIGDGLNGGTNWGSIDYRSKAPFVASINSSDECDQKDSKPNANENQNYTPLDFYNAAMSTGYTNSATHRPPRPSYWFVSTTIEFQASCSVASQRWGTTTSGGWLQFIHDGAHTLNTDCPTEYSGGCNTN